MAASDANGCQKVNDIDATAAKTKHTSWNTPDSLRDWVQEQQSLEELPGYKII